MSHNLLSHKMVTGLSIGAMVISVASLVMSYKAQKAVTVEVMTTEQVEKALKERPQMMKEAFMLLQQREAEERAKTQKEGIKGATKELFQHETNPVGGNPNGDVTMVEFFDYRCGFCRRVFGSLKDALGTDGNVKIIYKEYPIMGDLSDEGTKISRAALAAHKQGKYYDFHQALMNSKGSLEMSELEDIAKTLKLDIKKWKEDMNSEEIKKQIQENLALGQRLGIGGTPTFVLGEMVIPGAVDAEHFKRVFAEHRQKAKV